MLEAGIKPVHFNDHLLIRSRQLALRARNPLRDIVAEDAALILFQMKHTGTSSWAMPNLSYNNNT